MQNISSDSEDVRILDAPNQVLVCDNELFLSKKGIELPYYNTGLIPIENFNHFLFQEKNSYTHHLFFSEKDQLVLMTNRRNDLVTKLLNKLIPIQKSFEILDKELVEEGHSHTRDYSLKFILPEQTQLIYDLGFAPFTLGLLKSNEELLSIKTLHSKRHFYNKEFKECQLVSLSSFEEYFSNKLLNDIRSGQVGKHKSYKRLGYLSALVIAGIILFGLLHSVFWH